LIQCVEARRDAIEQRSLHAVNEQRRAHPKAARPASISVLEQF